jgi:hypothetical protein
VFAGGLQRMRIGAEIASPGIMKHLRTVGPCLLLLASACGTGRIPAVSADRESGQSGLMDKTVAGANKCNPKAHERPFIIEWDATDMSQFEALTSSDVVFVRYDGCDLKVVDSCKNDSVKGALGAYKTVDWTSGSVEKIDIKSEGELYAKLPLGVASLGARVAGGEHFLMEYFVAGSRTATRASQSKSELAKIPGCKGVTHFVYAYNLGAFALGSSKNINAEAGATVWGAGAGGSSKYASSVEKKGGTLASCRGESAKEVESCKTPIRLTLRPIEEGEDAARAAEQTPDTPASKNAAGALKAELDGDKKAIAHLQTAVEKIQARDGKGCLAELDLSDKGNEKTNPDRVSTNPRSPNLFLRSKCVMLAGQCDAGKSMARTYFLATGMKAAMTDTLVDSQAGDFCQGASMSPRDRLLKSHKTLRESTATAVSVSECQKRLVDFKSARQGVEAKDEDDVMITQAKSADPELLASQCLARAKACPEAWAMFRKSGNGEANFKTFRNVTVGCKDYTRKDDDARDPDQDAQEADKFRASASKKMFAKDGKGCLEDLNSHDKLVKPEYRSTTEGQSSTRALCLMLVSRCDEGEKLQRADLAKKGLAQNIIDGNIKSVRHDWCK